MLNPTDKLIKCVKALANRHQAAVQLTPIVIDGHVGYVLTISPIMLVKAGKKVEIKNPIEMKAENETKTGFLG